VSLPPLHPPFRLQLVESSGLDDERLYRSAYPTLKNFRYLKRLGLRSIVSLVPKDMVTPDLTSFCQNENVVHLSFAVSGGQRPLDADVNDENSPCPTHVLVANVLALAINPERMPCLVHCVDGAHVSGLVVAVLRKLQSWPSASIYEEFERFTKDHTEVSEDERKFISTFALPVALPPSLPTWLWTPTSFVVPPNLNRDEDEDEGGADA
jgi:tyrosine-protein phosphatase OCA6